MICFLYVVVNKIWVYEFFKSLHSVFSYIFAQHPKMFGTVFTKVVLLKDSASLRCSFYKQVITGLLIIKFNIVLIYPIVMCSICKISHQSDISKSWKTVVLNKCKSQLNS